MTESRQSPFWPRFVKSRRATQLVHPLGEFLEQPLNNRSVALRGGMPENRRHEPGAGQAAQEATPLDEQNTGTVARPPGPAPATTTSVSATTGISLVGSVIVRMPILLFSLGAKAILAWLYAID